MRATRTPQESVAAWAMATARGEPLLWAAHPYPSPIKARAQQHRPASARMGAHRQRDQVPGREAQGGQSQPRTLWSGKTARGTPRHRTSSANALVTPMPTAVRAAGSPAFLAFGISSVATAPAGGMSSTLHSSALGLGRGPLGAFHIWTSRWFGAIAAARQTPTQGPVDGQSCLVFAPFDEPSDGVSENRQHQCGSCRRQDCRRCAAPSADRLPHREPFS